MYPFFSYFLLPRGNSKPSPNGKGDRVPNSPISMQISLSLRLTLAPMNEGASIVGVGGSGPGVSSISGKHLSHFNL